MTEPDVASSDATNIQTSIKRDGDHYVINGRKWWSSGVGDPRCKIAIVMGKTDPSAPAHSQQSQILVPLDTPGIEVVRMLPVFGYDDAPHGHAEVVLRNVRVPAENLLLGEGRGFEIAQGRLGPGRIHHCMRTIGVAEVALEKMVKRLQSRVAFGKRLSEQSVWEQRIAEARIDIEMTRLLCLKAADMMDKAGNKTARLEIAMIKVAAPRMALRIIDDAIQAFGAAGVIQRRRPGQGLCAPAHDAPGRRPGRGAQPLDRALGVRPLQGAGLALSVAGGPASVGPHGPARRCCGAQRSFADEPGWAGRCVPAAACGRPLSCMKRYSSWLFASCSLAKMCAR